MKEERLLKPVRPSRAVSRALFLKQRTALPSTRRATLVVSNRERGGTTLSRPPPSLSRAPPLRTGCPHAAAANEPPGLAVYSFICFFTFLFCIQTATLPAPWQREQTYLPWPLQLPQYLRLPLPFTSTRPEPLHTVHRTSPWPLHCLHLHPGMSFTASAPRLVICHCSSSAALFISRRSASRSSLVFTLCCRVCTGSRRMRFRGRRLFFRSPSLLSGISHGILPAAILSRKAAEARVARAMELPRRKLFAGIGSSAASSSASAAMRYAMMLMSSIGGGRRRAP
mmetsp:Transcript_26905/g.84379  ORF Transcript_26905/g.84379 Transcript_26905/m.84379 type:complete len:283 (+) Transcript_26905:1148-1996(+)